MFYIIYMVKDSRSQGYKDSVCVRQLGESGLLANGIWHMVVQIIKQ